MNVLHQVAIVMLYLHSRFPSLSYLTASMLALRSIAVRAVVRQSMRAQSIQHFDSRVLRILLLEVFQNLENINAFVCSRALHARRDWVENTFLTILTLRNEHFTKALKYRCYSMYQYAHRGAVTCTVGRHSLRRDQISRRFAQPQRANSTFSKRNETSRVHHLFPNPISMFPGQLAPQYQNGFTISISANHRAGWDPTIHSSFESDEIRCSLVYTTLSECEHEIIDHYTALSYVWGDASDLKKVLVDGAERKVTSNLHKALLHIREESRPLRMWADAICINQEDDDEKSVQVAMMGQVYAAAAHTIIFLSTPVDDLGEDAEPIDLELAEIIVHKSWFKRVWVFQELIFPKNP